MDWLVKWANWLIKRMELWFWLKRLKRCYLKITVMEDMAPLVEGVVKKFFVIKVENYSNRLSIVGDEKDEKRRRVSFYVFFRQAEGKKIKLLRADVVDKLLIKMGLADLNLQWEN